MKRRAERRESQHNSVAKGNERGPRGAAPERQADQRAPRPASSNAGESEHLYGVAPVLEALRAGVRSIERVTIAEDARRQRLRELIEEARRANVPVRYAPRLDLAHAVGAGANHQGVVATVAAASYADADELLEALARRVGTDDPPLAVVLDGVEDPRNLGAILRTSECAGAHGVFVPERRAAGLTETAAKTAAGALEHISVARAANLARLIEEFKGRNIWTVGTSADAPTLYTAWDWTQPTALFLGGEGAGLHRLVRERCDALVSIPVLGKIESLNVSVAAGVVLYEAVRQRAESRRRSVDG
jgi:23S rRNA (guanosine2251-2'-O)-methyltransferase